MLHNSHIIKSSRGPMYSRCLGMRNPVSSPGVAIARQRRQLLAMHRIGSCHVHAHCHFHACQDRPFSLWTNHDWKRQVMLPTPKKGHLKHETWQLPRSPASYASHGHDSIRFTMSIVLGFSKEFFPQRKFQLLVLLVICKTRSDENEIKVR